LHANVMLVLFAAMISLWRKLNFGRWRVTCIKQGKGNEARTKIGLVLLHQNSSISCCVA
jgi:hypothetical protein